MAQSTGYVPVRMPCQDKACVCDRQLNSASTDSGEWISKYQKAEEGRSVAVSDKDRVERELRAQLSQAEQQLAQAKGKQDQAEQQAQAAQALLTQERQQFEQRLQQAQAESRAEPPASAAPGEPSAVHHCLCYVKPNAALSIKHFLIAQCLMLCLKLVTGRRPVDCQLCRMLNVVGGLVIPATDVPAQIGTGGQTARCTNTYRLLFLSRLWWTD